MFAVYAVPLVGERFLRRRRTRTTELARVRETLTLCGVDPDAVPPEVIDRSVTLLEEREDVEGMDRAFLAAARSLLRLLVDPRRYRAAMASIRVPVLLVHGDRDRLVPVAAARDIARRHPAWRYLELADVGHVPAAAGARAAGRRTCSPGWTRRRGRPARTAGRRAGCRAAPRARCSAGASPSCSRALLVSMITGRLAASTHSATGGRNGSRATARAAACAGPAGTGIGQRAELAGDVDGGDDAVAGDVVGARRARRRRRTAAAPGRRPPRG